MGVFAGLGWVGWIDGLNDETRKTKIIESPVLIPKWSGQTSLRHNPDKKKKKLS